MVFNRILDVSAKASEYYGGGGTNDTNTSSSNIPPLATSSISNTGSKTQHTASSKSSGGKSYWDYSAPSAFDVVDSVSNYLSSSWTYYESYIHWDTATQPNKNVSMTTMTDDSKSVAVPTRRRSDAKTLFDMITWHTSSSPRDIAWMTLFKNNPYTCVTGRQIEPSSMAAVRDLIALVPSMSYDPDHYYPNNVSETAKNETIHRAQHQPTTPNCTGKKPKSFLWKSTQPTSFHRQNNSLLLTTPEEDDDLTEAIFEEDDVNDIFRHHTVAVPKSSSQRNNSKDVVTPSRSGEDTFMNQQRDSNPNKSSYYSPSETASHLAEGTIRALRDLGKDYYFFLDKIDLVI
jgi:hypothetical protein